MNEGSVPDVPLRMGTREEFALVATALSEAGFDEPTVCKTLNIENNAELNSVESADCLQDAPKRLALFIRLFLFLDFVPRAEVEGELGRSTVDAFLALDLLRIGDFGPDQYYTPIFLYPVSGLLIASDRHTSPDGGPFVPPPDIVFPAIFIGTLRFLRVLPRSGVADAIDLCSGSGVGALVLSKHAKNVIASDITKRAAHFARFNGMLNGCENLEAVVGDLFSSVVGRTFDCITAHPPYMPTFRPTAIWRDGGETGEILVQRIIKDLPQYLRPGGTTYIVTIGLDTEAGQFEERARQWLGDPHAEFDIVFASGNEVTAETVVKGIAKRDPRATPADLERLQQAFKSEQTLRIMYGVLVIHRRVEASGDPWTARTRLSLTTDGSDFEWAFAWHRRRAAADFLSELARTKARLSPNLRVKVMHHVLEGELLPTEFTLESDKPFLFAMKADGLTVTVVTRFNGELTTNEVYQAASEAEELPAGLKLEDFLKHVAFLVDHGFLVLD